MIRESIHLEEIYFLKNECSFIDGEKGKGYTYFICEKERDGKI